MKKLITLLLSLSLTAVANATLLEFDFEDRDYQVGEEVAVNIVISDIENDDFGFQRTLTEFEVDFLFDDLLLRFSQLTFGNLLNLGNVNNSDQDGSALGDIVSLSEATDLDVVDVDSIIAAQGSVNSFVLATITFNARSVGNSIFSFDFIDLYDDSGALFDDINSNGARLNIVAAEVPEPSVFALFLVAGLALVARKKSIVK